MLLLMKQLQNGDILSMIFYLLLKLKHE